LKSLKQYITLLFLMQWAVMFSQYYTNYTTQDGLPSNHVYRVTQDHKGFIWFITDKGMVRYNGASFKTFTTKDGLPTNDIWDIRVTPDNRIWFFSKSAQLGYIENNTVFSFESNVKGEILYPVVIIQNKNKVCFSNSARSYYLENDKWASVDLFYQNNYRELVIHDQISELVVDPDSLSIKNKSNKTIRKISKPKVINGVHQRSQINDSLFVWVNDERYSVLNLNNLELVDRDFDHELHRKRAKLVRASATNGEIQFSGKDFVGVLDRHYNFSQTVHIPKELNSHFSFIDKDQNLWIATFNNGVYFIPAAKRKSNYLLNGQKIGKLSRINNQIVVSVYNKGFYQFQENKNQFTPLISENEFIYTANQIKELNTIYYCTNKRIIKHTDSKKEIFTFKSKHNYIGRKFVYFQSKLYGDSSSGINVVNPSSLLSIKTYEQNGVRDLIVFKKNLLIATSNGLKILEKDSIQFVFNTASEYNRPIISLVKISDDELLIGTDGFGAYITNLKKIKLLEQTEFLSVQVAFSKNNELWLATNEGVWHYQKQDKTYKLKNKYTINQGLTTQLINSIYVFDNKIMAGTNEGICIIPIEKDTHKPISKIYLEKLAYNKKQIQKGAEIYYTSNNSLEVSIAEIDFCAAKNLTYNYQLLPTQKKWLSSGSERISFNNLPPNAYTLTIKKGDLSEHFRFSIKPLWWQTSFFKIGIRLLFLSLTLFLFWRIRKRELRKKTTKLNTQKELAEYELYALRSQMNPHFVFNSLNAIQYYLTDNKIELSEKYLVKFSKLIRMFFDFSQSKLISVEEESKLLHAYLEIEKLRFGEEFNYTIKVDSEISDRKIPSMLLQPVVENAVNHGLFHKHGKGFISVLFVHVNEKRYDVIIEDDGIGREKSKEINKNTSTKHKRKSGMILQDRINLLNLSKQCDVSYTITNLNAKENTGTRVHFIFESL